MKALKFNGKTLKLEEVPRPVPGEKEALIRIRYAGICNTDLEIMKGYMNYTGILGHEFVGVVEEASYGDWIGKTVVGEINLGCGECEFCRRGMKTHCRRRKVLGIQDKDGVMAEYCTLPIHNLHVVPPTIPALAAVFVEPLAAACEILEQLNILPEYQVVVLGDGKLAQLIAQVLRLHSRNLLVVGKHPKKLELLRDSSIKTMSLDEFRRSDDLFHVVVEATGSWKGWELALQRVRPKGFIVLKSTYANTLEFNPAPIVINEITVIGSRCGPFANAISLLEHNQVDVEKLISGIYSLTNFEKAFRRSRESGVLKILLEPDSAE